MDILHRKLHSVNDPVFFIRSSVEYPFIYLRFGGIVKEIETIDEHTTYRIQIVKVLEDYDTILKFLNRVRFRVKNLKNGAYIDKYFYTYDIPTEIFEEGFCDRFNQYLIDLPSMFCFTTYEEMNNELSNVNQHITESLATQLKWLGKRVLDN